MLTWAHENSVLPRFIEHANPTRMPTWVRSMVCYVTNASLRTGSPARGTFDPAYGSYTLGKLMIRKLREDWTSTRGGRQAWQAFHDELLNHGSPPIPLVRKTMMGGGTSSLF